MGELLDRIGATAAAQYGGEREIPDLAAAASVLKTLAEAGKAEAEAENYQRQLRHERLKTWSALLIPLVSLLSLMGTVLFQGIQLREQTSSAIRQSEDTEWRDMIATLRGPAANYASDITVPSRLQPFLDSERYRNRARDLAIRLMGNLTNLNAFVELYQATAQDGDSESLKRNIGIARALMATQTALDSECISEASSSGIPPEFPFGVCTLMIPHDTAMTFAKMTKDPRTAFQRRQAYFALAGEIAFVGERIGEHLRQVTGKPGVSPGIDLSFLSLRSVDLSGVDFSSISIRNSFFSFSKLNGSKCTPTNWDGFDIGDSEWWNCGSIDQKMLAVLLEYRYPYYDQGIFAYPSGEVTREFYEGRVAILCTSQMKACIPPLKFLPPRPMMPMTEQKMTEQNKSSSAPPPWPTPPTRP